MKHRPRRKFFEVIDKFEAMELPPGYDMFWDGEYDSTITAQLSLIPGGVPALVIMTLIIVALFNAVRPSLIMALTVPFALIGITAILAPTFGGVIARDRFFVTKAFYLKSLLANSVFDQKISNRASSLLA